MDTEKTNTKTEAKKLNNSTTPTDDNQDFYNGLIYSLFEEATDEICKQTEAEKAEFNKILARFAKLEGVDDKSLYVMMYAGFYWGVGKGIELIQRMENKA